MIHLNTQKIIITTDFSDTSMLAVKHGAFLAQYTKGSIYLVHVITKHWEKFNVFTPSITLDNLEAASSSVQEKLNEIASGIKKDYGVEVTTVVCTGNPTTEIIKTAKEVGANLIVMGTHGYSAWEDLTIGSNTLKVITKSECPVLTMSQPTDKIGYRNIVLPIDTSGHSRHKVVYTLELAKLFSAHVHVAGILGTGEENDIPAMKLILSQIETAAKERGVTCDTELITNVKNRALETIKFSEKVGGDLVSIMSDQEAEMSGIFLGPYALQVIHHSKVPVLTIKPEENAAGGNWTVLAGS